jgi:DNA-binding winged helix-turn-helix (wHTH) protein/TolB-like protein
MAVKLRHFYEFGPFRLEPDEQLLVSNSQPVPIAPKYFELLVFLVQNCGRLVTKDQIMQTVWSGSFVEEANLTVAVSAIRKALGDKEANIRYTETVPKKGYRFTAEVREVEELPGTTPMPKADLTPLDFNALTVKKDDGAPATAQPLRDPARPAISISLANRRRIVRPALILVSVAVLLGYALHLKQAARKPFSGEPRSLAILPLQNLKPDVDSDFLGFSLADVLITKLAYVSSLSVRPSAAIEKYRGTAIDLERVAEDLKVDTLLTGSFIRDGDNLRITYQLVDAKTEKILGQGVLDLKYDNLLTVQDKVTSQLISELQLSLSPSEAERLKPENPVRPLAYEYFLQGLDFHGQHKFPLAIKMLEKSTEIDPNYAPAWAYLGASYTSDAAFEFGGRDQYRRAQEAYQRALAIRPTLLDAQVFLANLLVDTGKVEQAVPLLRVALKTNGNYAAAHWELGYAYRFAGMLNESLAECERARELDPLVKANGSVLNTYLYLGQYQKFLESLPLDDSAFILFYRGFGEFHEKEFDRASKDFDRAYELDPNLYTGIGKSLSDLIHQHRAEGLKRLSGLERKIGERGVGDPEATYKIAEAYAVLGDKTSALRVLRESVESGFFGYPYIAKDPLLNDLHSELEFSQILGIARQRHEAFKSSFYG